MEHPMNRLMLILGISVFAGANAWAQAQAPAPHTRTRWDSLAHDLLKELIEINTTQSVGSTAQAAKAMAARLRSAGFPDSDVVVVENAPRKGNLVRQGRRTGPFRRSRSRRRPIPFTRAVLPTTRMMARSTSP